MTDGRDEEPEGPAGDGPLGFGPGAEPGRPADADAGAAPDADPDTGSGPGGRGPRRAPAGLVVNTGRYTWWVGIAAVIVIVIVTVNSITTQGPGSRGVVVGQVAPPFAAPLIDNRFPSDEDFVNVARRANQDDAGDVPACSIRRSDVLNICALYRTRPVVLAFFATRGSPCADQLDTLQRISARRQDVAFAAIAIKAERGRVRDIVADRGWTFPVAYDRDGVLSTLYNVVICPELTFIARGGRVAGTSFGDRSEAELLPRIDALAAGRPLPPE